LKSLRIAGILETYEMIELETVRLRANWKKYENDFYFSLMVFYVMFVVVVF
jgi:hypothetical protein